MGSNLGRLIAVLDGCELHRLCACDEQDELVGVYNDGVKMNIDESILKISKN